MLHALPFSFACAVELNLAAVPWTGPPLQSVVLPCSSFLWLRVFLELVSWTVCYTFAFYLDLKTDPRPIAKFQTKVLNKH